MRMILNRNESLLKRAPLTVRIFPSLDTLEKKYFREHPEEVDDYLNHIFDEFAKDGDITALLGSLRVLGRIRGVTLPFKT